MIKFKKLSKIFSLALSLVILASSIPLNIVNAEEVVYKPSAAGGASIPSGGSGTSAGAGRWEEDMQGLRITVLNAYGEPAMLFMGKYEHLDLLFSRRKLGQVDYFAGGSKLQYYRYPTCTSIAESKSSYLVLSELVSAIKNKTYGIKIPTEGIGTYPHLASIPKPITEKNGVFSAHGDAIRKALYGDNNSENLVDKTSMFYNIFGLYDGAGYLWSFRDDSVSSGHIKALKKDYDAMYDIKNPSHKKSPIFDANGKETDKTRDTKTLLYYMQKYGYTIEVEPIIWAQLRHDANVFSPYTVYGTQTSLGYTIDWLSKKSSFKNAINKQYGGYDTALFGAVGRKSMYMSSNVRFHGSVYFINGKMKTAYDDKIDSYGVKYSKWLASPKLTSSKIDNLTVWSSSPTWSVQLYIPSSDYGKIDENNTYTWDSEKDPDNKNLVPAPEPPSTSKSEDKHYRIVKVYEDEVQDSETTTTIQHVTTNIREQTIPSIYVQDEAKYKVIEWKYGNPYTPVKESTQWDDTEISSITTIKQGKQQDYVEIADPADKTKEVTLYVRLRKPLVSETGVVEPTNLTINESQLSKAIHTNDSTVEGDNWGKYGFSFSIGSFKDSKKLSYTDSDGKSHSKNVTTDNGWTDNSLTLVFKQQGTKDAMQIAEGVNSLSNNKVYSNNGVQNTKLNSFGKSDINISRDGTKANGADLVTLIWRNQDKPTLAKYKQTDIISTLGSNNFNVPNGLIGSSNVGLGKRQANGSKNYNLALSFGLDNSSDKSATSVSETWHGKKASTSKTLQLKMGEWAYQFKGVVKIDTYRGTSKAIGNEPFSDGKSTSKTFQTSSHFEATETQGKQNIQFFPYIKMSYMTNELDRAIREEKNKSYYINDSRFDTYVLSEQKSSILPSDAVEVGWVNSNEEESLLLDTQQWTMHTKGTDGSSPWKQPNRVLPGGALYELYTPEATQTDVKLVTYQTIVDSKTRGYLSASLSGNEYTEALAASSHSSFVSNAREVLDNLRVVQWVRKIDWESLNTDSLKAWGDNWASASGALKILGGGQSLGELGMEHKTNTEEKYHIKQGTDKVRTSDGDLDIVSENQVSTIFKVFTDTAGNVYLASYTETDNTKAKDIAGLTAKLKDVNADTYTKYSNIKTELLFDKTVNWKDVQGRLSEDAAQINSRTSIITNIVKSLERNTGNDKTAAWAKTDGKWYNEAFDGIYVVRQATTMKIGFMQPLMRGAVLDPALCPPNKGKADLFSTAFLSQFCVNDTSDASIASGKGNQYIGTFKGKDICLPEMQGMYQSKKFYIPNVNVQDLRG